MNMNKNGNLKSNIGDIAKRNGWTGYRLAKELGVTFKTGYSLMKGELPSLDTIAKACRVLNLQPGDILEFVE